MKEILAVVGSRTFNNYNLMKEELSKMTFDEIVSGGARGADTLAECYANEFNIPIKVFGAQWEQYGKAAGYIRNKLIADYATRAIVFWDGRSKGSDHVIKCFISIERPYKIVTF